MSSLASAPGREADVSVADAEGGDLALPDPDVDGVPGDAHQGGQRLDVQRFFGVGGSGKGKVRGTGGGHAAFRPPIIPCVLRLLSRFGPFSRRTHRNLQTWCGRLARKRVSLRSDFGEVRPGTAATSIAKWNFIKISMGLALGEPRTGQSMKPGVTSTRVPLVAYAVRCQKVFPERETLPALARRATPYQSK